LYEYDATGDNITGNINKCKYLISGLSAITIGHMKIDISVLNGER
jgi:hypothetical protein